MGRELLGTARRLARASVGRPRQSDLKRAISAAYYALFHEVARKGADRLVGMGPNRPDKAWRHTDRALNHGDARNACKQLRSLGFPADLIRVGDVFQALQVQRHDADYDPTHRVTRVDALAAIVPAEDGTEKLNATDIRDRIAFAIQLLLKQRA